MSIQQPSRRRVASDERAVALPLPDAGFPHGLYLPLDNVSLGDPGDAQVTMSGNFVVSWLDSTFDGTVDADSELETFDAGIGLKGAVTIELAAQTEGEFAQSLRLAMIPLPPITVEPVVVTPYVEVNLHLAGTADAGARVSLVAPFHVDTRVRNAGPPDPSSRPGLEVMVGPPDAAEAIAMQARVELEVVVAFMTSIGGVPVGGPVLGTSFGILVTVTADPNAPAWWDIDGLAKIVGDWAFLDLTAVPPLPAIPDHLETVFGPERWNIASADGPLPFIGTESSRWSKVYDIGEYDVAVAALPFENGLILVEQGRTPWLASLDALGAPRWQQILTDIDAHAMVAATDGDLVVAGDSGVDARVERYDRSTGAPSWARTLSVSGADEVTFTAMAPTADGVVVAGAVNRSSVWTPIVAALDDAGDVRWATELDAGSGSTSPNLYAIAVTPDGEILAVGSADFTDAADVGGPPITGDNALIVRLNADGDALAAYAWSGPSKALQITMCEDGSCAIGGYIGGSLPNVRIASLTDDDALQWSGSYQSRPDTDGIDDAHPTGLAAVSGNGWLVSGRIGGEGTEDAWAMLIDGGGGGMPCWLKTYRSADDDELSGIVAARDGLFAFGSTGMTEQPGGFSDIWVLRTSVDGQLHFTADSGIETESTAVQWQSRPEDALHALMPSNIATTLEGPPAMVPPEFTIAPANTVGETITE